MPIVRRIQNPKPEDPDPRLAIPHLPDQRLFRFYQEPSTMKVNPNVLMTVGTGGVGIWERAWREIALDISGTSEYGPLSTGDQPGVIRAMYIAQAAAHHSRMQIQSLAMQFFSVSPDGRASTQRFRKVIFETSQNDQEALANFDAAEQERNSQAAAYMERHPTDGQEKFTTLENIATDILETGQHLAYMALYHSQKDLMPHARRFIGTASTQLQDNVDEPEKGDQAIQTATAGETEAQKALSHVNLITNICNTGKPEHHDVIRHFAATAYVARWTNRAAARNLERFAILGAKDGGLPATAKELSDEILSLKKDGYAAQAVNALAANEPTQAEEAFTLMQSAEESLAAIAYGWRRTQQEHPLSPEPAPTLHELLSSINCPEPHSELADLAALAKSLPEWPEFLYDTPPVTFRTTPAKGSHSE